MPFSQLENAKLCSDQNERAASAAREELNEARLRIEALSYQLSGLQKQVRHVGPVSLPSPPRRFQARACLGELPRVGRARLPQSCQSRGTPSRTASPLVTGPRAAGKEPAPETGPCLQGILGKETGGP